jgi:hypothetical protein
MGLRQINYGKPPLENLEKKRKLLREKPIQMLEELEN